MNYENTELTSHELLARSFQEIKKRFVPFFILSLCTPAFGWLVNGLLLGFSPTTQAQSGLQFPLMRAAAALLSALAGLWFLAAFIFYVCKRADSVVQALAMGLFRGWRLVWATLFISVIIILAGALLAAGPILLMVSEYPDITALSILIAAAAALLFFIIVVVLSVYLCMWFYRLVLAEESFFTSLRKAYLLVKGRFWKTLGFMLLLVLINMGVAMVCGIVLLIVSILIALAAPSLSWLTSLCYVPVTALTTLIVQVPMIALYLDRLSAENRPAPEANRTSGQDAAV